MKTGTDETNIFISGVRIESIPFTIIPTPSTITCLLLAEDKKCIESDAMLSI
jgi:hypothetical protein